MSSGVPRGSSAKIEALGRDHPQRRSALRIIVGDSGGSSEAVENELNALLEATAAQGLRIDPVLGYWEGDRMTAACAAIVSPGRSASVLLGTSRDAATQRSTGRGDADVTLLETLQHHTSQQGVAFLQALLDPNDSLTAEKYRDAGFKYLSELVYLVRTVAKPVPHIPITKELSYLAYSDNLKGRFIDVLNATYTESLDCPGLSGRRDTNDVLIGHRHTGIHDPGLWRLALQGDSPVGVLLMSGVHNSDSLEIVYIGVAADARGQGIGDALVLTAIELARVRNAKALTLAVDCSNRPARRLYERWGFEDVARRRAWVAFTPL